MATVIEQEQTRAVQLDPMFAREDLMLEKARLERRIGNAQQQHAAEEHNVGSLESMAAQVDSLLRRLPA